MREMLSPIRRIRLWIGVILAVLLVASSVSSGNLPNHRDWKYVHKVLLTSETGEYDGFISRWNRPPRVGVISKDLKRHPPIVRSVINELNAVLAGTGMSLTLVWKNPDILIQFVESARLREAGAELGCEMVLDTVAYFCTWRGDEKQFDIHIAVIVVQTDGETGDFYSMVLEELTQALGAVNDVQDPTFEGSLFYEYEEGVSAPYFKVLSHRDKKLLRFLYTHLKPGDTEKEVRAAFDRHWDAIRVPGSD